MINVRACISSGSDIFDGPCADTRIGNTTDQRVRYVERLEEYAIKYQGEPYRTYLNARVRDKTADKKLKSYMDSFIAACPLNEKHRGLARIRRRFAITYASAALAIDYGILPWGKKPTLRDVQACMDDAIKQLTAHIGPTTDRPMSGRPDEEALLADFKRRIDGASFLRIEPRRHKSRSLRRRLQNSAGVVRPTSSGGKQYLLFSKTLKAWFSQASTRKRLTSLLREHGIIKKGRRSDTATRQVAIAELGGRIACYTISRERLRDL